MTPAYEPAVWFPTVRTGTGTDVFTDRLAAGLEKRGIRAEITWLPLRAEYAPWTVPVPKPPTWANIAHVNTWLPFRFLPKHLPIVATIHHSVHHTDAEYYKGAVRSAYHQFWIAPNERRVLGRADRVVAVSRFVAKACRETLLDVPMEVIYNGVDSGKFRPGNRQRKMNEPFRLLYVGSWTARKGVDLLAPIMRELGEEFELRYTGGSAAQRDKRAMPPNMHDIGRLLDDDAVVAAMQDADALLFPSRSEGHPLVAVEAMACGLPVIATCDTSVVEVIEDRLSGILCRMNDVADYAKAARSIALNAESIAKMRSAARSRVLERFQATNCLARYIALYRKLFALGGRR